MQMQIDPLDILYKDHLPFNNTESSLNYFTLLRFIVCVCLFVLWRPDYTSIYVLTACATFFCVERFAAESYKLYISATDAYKACVGIITALPNMILHALSDAHEYEHASFPWKHTHGHHHHDHASFVVKTIVMVSTCIATQHDLKNDKDEKNANKNIFCC